MPSFHTLTVTGTKELADRLVARAGEASLADRAAVLETQARHAGKLIRVLLRHVSPHDVFQIPEGQ
jgi:hypothetical protein